MLEKIKGVFSRSSESVKWCYNKTSKFSNAVWSWFSEHKFMFLIVAAVTSPLWFVALILLAGLVVAYMAGIVLALPVILWKGTGSYMSLVYRAITHPLRLIGVLDEFVVSENKPEKKEVTSEWSIAQIILSIVLFALVTGTGLFCVVNQFDGDFGRGPRRFVERKVTYNQENHHRHNRWNND